MGSCYNVSEHLNIHAMQRVKVVVDDVVNDVEMKEEVEEEEKEGGDGMKMQR